MKFRSKFEKAIAALLKNNKVKFSYEPFKLAYILKSSYTPDFVIPKEFSVTGGDIIVETKGFFKSTDRRKMLAVRECNPNLDIRLWFMRDTYLNNKTKGSKYSDWAVKHSFPYHIGEVLPKHWLKGS